MNTVLLTILVNVVLLVAGFVIGRRYPKSTKDPSICSCTHVYSVHSKQKGVCGSRDHKYPSWKCPCVNYDGVPPAQSLFKDVF